MSIARCPVCGAATVAVDAPPPLNANKALEDAVKAANPAFWRAVDKLAAQLGPERKAGLARWAEVVLRTGKVSLTDGVMPTVPVMIAFLHVTTGTPVHITDSTDECVGALGQKRRRRGMQRMWVSASAGVSVVRAVRVGDSGSGDAR